MEYKNIKFKVKENIATIFLNRPKALNALNNDINVEIMDALDKINADSSIRVLIMTGSPRAFAAGADVTEMANANPRFAREFCSLAIKINNTLESMPIPTIAAVGGLALGGGMEMVLSCDFRVGGLSTTISLPEVGLGIIPGANGGVRVTSILGPAKAKELVMLSPMIKGKEAYELGLLNWLATPSEDLTSLDGLSDEEKKEAKIKNAQIEYDAIYEKAVEIANKLKEKPRCALAAAKNVINTAANQSIEAGKTTETYEVSLLFDTEDQKEGMAAMLEKRPPKFKHK